MPRKNERRFPIITLLRRILQELKSESGFGRHHTPMGITTCGGLWGRDGSCTGDVPDHYRDTPLFLYIAGGYIILVIQTIFSPKSIIPLAYDSGGVTTSTVTVPLVAALGLGLSATIPGRNPALDGFGLIAFASLFPMIAVKGYAQIVQWWTARRSKSSK